MFRLIVGLLAVLGVHSSVVVVPSLFKPELAGNIIFASNRSGSWGIYQKDLAKDVTTPLVVNSYDNLNPQLSPDKKYLVYYSNQSGTNQIYRLDLEHKVIDRLTRNHASEYDPRYSPDGKKIVFKSNLDDGLGDVWIMDADGSNRRNLTSSLSITEEWGPVFSKDGTKIYFTSGLEEYSEILVIDSDMGDKKLIASITHNFVPDWYPAVNPVTGELALISRDKGSTQDSIFKMLMNGQKRIKLVNLPGDSDDPSWSDDGSKIVFINRNNSHYSIYQMNSDGTGLVALDKSDSNELSPIYFD